MTTPLVICSPAAEPLLPLLLTNKPTSLVVDASAEVKVEEPHVDEPFAKRVCSSSSMHPISSMSQSISTTDRLSIIRDFEQRTGIDEQLAETEDEIDGYLRARLENPRRE